LEVLDVGHLKNLALHIHNTVLERTDRRVWDLAVEVLPERVVLRGATATFYAKQLAQESVRKMLPQIRLENAIVVAAA